MVELTKVDCKVGISISGGADRSSRPQVVGLTPGGAAHRSDVVCVGDRLRAVNGNSTDGLLHQQVVDMLRTAESRVQLELEYDMPESVVSNESMCACPRVIQVLLEKEQGSFGFTVRGGSCADDPVRSRPLTITHVRPGGPTDREGTVKPGDRLLAVDGVRLTHASLDEAHRALTSVARQAVITVEYDVSVMEAVRAGAGPLLVEVENGSMLGLALSATTGGGPIVIESIRQASIAERVGALHVGDQVLAIDDVSVEHMSAAEACRRLQNCPGQTVRLEIVPVSARRPSDVKRCKATLPPSLHATSSALSTSSCGSGSYNTLGSGSRRRPAGRPGRKHRGHGDGSSGASGRQQMGSASSDSRYAVVGATLCHQETVQLDLQADSHGFGLALTSRSSPDDRTPPLIGHIEPDSPADRCGILHVGDRLLEVNHQPVDDLTVDQAAQLLADCLPRVTIVTEFDVADAVVPSSGTFLIKLVKRGPSLGLAVSAPKRRQLGEPLVVLDVEPGSVAHRNGTIEPGDRLLSIDGAATDRLSIHEATDRLLAAGDIVTLCVQKDTIWSDVPHTAGVVFTVELERHCGPLGLTLCGTEEPFDPICIAALTEGGLAGRTGALHTGDRVLAINGMSLRGRSLSEASRQLLNCGDVVRLKVAKVTAGRPDRTPVASTLGSVDSAVESWDSASAELPRPPLTGSGSGSGSGSVDGATKAGSGSCHRDSGGAGGERWETAAQRLAARTPSALTDDAEAEDHWDKVYAEMKQVESFQRDLPDQSADDGADCAVGGGGLARRSGGRAVVAVRPPRLPNWSTDKAGPHQSESELAERRQTASLPRRREEARGTASAPEFHLPGSYTALSSDSPYSAPVQIHRVVLFKDAVYEDFGFSLSNALYKKGVYVNRMKPAGPADKSGILRPYDRILKVNDTVTTDHDSCHIVPLIASVGDRLELVVARNPLTEQQPQLEDAGHHPWVEDVDKISPSPEPADAPDLANRLL